MWCRTLEFSILNGRVDESLNSSREEKKRIKTMNVMKMTATTLCTKIMTNSLE